MRILRRLVVSRVVSAPRPASRPARALRRTHHHVWGRGSRSNKEPDQWSRPIRVSRMLREYATLAQEPVPPLAPAQRQLDEGLMLLPCVAPRDDARFVLPGARSSG